MNTATIKASSTTAESIENTGLVASSRQAAFIVHDWCGWNWRYGRFTAMPNGETLVCNEWMNQMEWDSAQLQWLEQFDESLVVHKCPTGPYRETGNTIGTVGEIKERLRSRIA